MGQEVTRHSTRGGGGASRGAPLARYGGGGSRIARLPKGTGQVRYPGDANTRSRVSIDCSHHVMATTQSHTKNATDTQQTFTPWSTFPSTERSRGFRFVWGCRVNRQLSNQKELWAKPANKPIDPFYFHPGICPVTQRQKSRKAYEFIDDGCLVYAFKSLK